ncbi:MAG: hypothetical protein JNL42_03555 [Anaerolineae bacterium]|nr:hypothetical protein [Anaerolineae bacterium]
MLPDRLAIYRTGPLAELLTVLLRQLRRPLAAQGAVLSDADCEEVAGRITRREVRDAEADAALTAALIRVVEESRGALAAWGLTFEQSMITEIGDLPNWNTTGEFLEVAAEKTNAELRISAGSAVLAALGDVRYSDLLLFLAAGEGGEAADVEAIIARRMLGFACGVADDAPDGLEQLRACIERAK